MRITLKMMAVISSVKAGATLAPQGHSLPSTLARRDDGDDDVGDDL